MSASERGWLSLWEGRGLWRRLRMSLVVLCFHSQTSGLGGGPCSQSDTSPLLCLKKGRVGWFPCASPPPPPPAPGRGGGLPPNTTDENERALISKLKLKCGAPYTSKLEGMSGRRWGGGDAVVAFPIFLCWCGG